MSKYTSTINNDNAQPIFCPEEGDAQIPQGFWDKNGSANSVQATKP